MNAWASAAQAEASGLVVRVGGVARIDGAWVDVTYPSEWQTALIGGKAVEVMPLESARKRFQRQPPTSRDAGAQWTMTP